MKCTRIKLGDGMVIVCGATRHVDKCKECGKPATKLCDWKLDKKHTCDAPLCDACAQSPEKDKDLCGRHAKAWKQHPANPKRVA